MKRLLSSYGPGDVLEINGRRAVVIAEPIVDRDGHRSDLSTVRFNGEVVDVYVADSDAGEVEYLGAGGWRSTVYLNEESGDPTDHDLTQAESDLYYARTIELEVKLKATESEAADLKSRLEASTRLLENRRTLSHFPIGSRVYVGPYLEEARVTHAIVGPGGLQYGVEWWSMKRLVRELVPERDVQGERPLPEVPHPFPQDRSHDRPDVRRVPAANHGHEPGGPADGG